MKHPRRDRRTFIATGAVALAFAASTAGPIEASAATRSVIVVATRTRAAADAVGAAGGSVVARLPIVSGVSAKVPGDAIAALESAPGVVSVTPDRVVKLAGSDWNGDDQNRSVFNREIDADVMRTYGIDGSGVRVALIDTGVADVPDLEGRLAKVPDPTGTGALVDCVNFSGEASCNDSYGHGTFIAGLIAGTGASSGGRYAGVAPGAQIVPIKIAGRDGSADITKVLAAIEWVVSFAKELNIRVLNLSLGTDSPMSYRVDPLNLAVERAWRAGITVVVSAGNRGVMTADGPQPGTISKPADDPLVVSVGAVDDRRTSTLSDDRVPFFSAHGPTIADGLAKPDVVAPGGHVISLRSPGSYVEEHAPGGGVDATYRRGSGTSMSAGIVSGVAALIAQARPAWSPDRVKFALMSTAHKVAVRDPLWIGAGIVDAARAGWIAPSGIANQDVTTLSDASGALDGTRANVIVALACASSTSPMIDVNCGRALRDSETAQGRAFDARQYAQGDWTSSTWYVGQWNALLGSSWYGSSWYGSSWYGSSWYGSSWYGSFDDSSYGVAMAGSSWYGVWD